MNTVVLSKTYPQPPFCQKEILRYAGCKQADAELTALLQACLQEAAQTFTYQVCYRELSVHISGDQCDFDAFCLQSRQLAANLKDCERVIVFAATVGVQIDRLIAKYSRLSPAKALLFQAIGAERIEALCNVFCQDIETQYKSKLRPRFSPGYGDLALTAQKEIFSLLDCAKRIGLSLNDSLLMSPSKSVTAFVGIPRDASTKLLSGGIL